MQLRKRFNLESTRCEEMNPETVATHFDRFCATVDKQDVKELSSIFKLDESGF